mmetsp:Transcript_56201/g.158402  ORF Transcript_56201/g.158402 Transcript_56201/m.158402 type:complete len:391 (+) Transcript_56201:974-2146(+)
MGDIFAGIPGVGPQPAVHDRHTRWRGERGQDVQGHRGAEVWEQAPREGPAVRAFDELRVAARQRRLGHHVLRRRPLDAHEPRHGPGPDLLQPRQQPLPGRAPHQLRRRGEIACLHVGEPPLLRPRRWLPALDEAADVRRVDAGTDGCAEQAERRNRGVPHAGGRREPVPGRQARSPELVAGADRPREVGQHRSPVQDAGRERVPAEEPGLRGVRGQQQRRRGGHEPQLPWEEPRPQDRRDLLPGVQRVQGQVRQPLLGRHVRRRALVGGRVRAGEEVRVRGGPRVPVGQVDAAALVLARHRQGLHRLAVPPRLGLVQGQALVPGALPEVGARSSRRGRCRRDRAGWAGLVQGAGRCARQGPRPVARDAAASAASFADAQCCAGRFRLFPS